MIKKFFENITEKKLAGIISILFLLTFIIAYPGTFTPDTMFQYQQALTGNFHPHHPPIMAKLWSMFIKVSPNPSLMLGFNQMLLWASVYNFFLAFNNKEFGRIKYLYLLIPFLPYVLTYMIPIWKDVAFAFSYLLVASILTRSAITKTPLTIGSFMLCLIMLFYGTGAKYQAMFVLPIYSLWIATAIANNGLTSYKSYTCLIKPFICKVSKIAALSVCLFIGILYFSNTANETLSKNAEAFYDIGKKNERPPVNSWQVKELYDLAGISLASNINYFPQYITNSEGYNLEQLRDAYNNEYVGADLLIEGSKPLLKMVEDQDKLESLHNAWLKAITRHPFYYLKHRLVLWKEIVLKPYYPELINPAYANNYNPKNYLSKNSLFKKVTFKYLAATRVFSIFIFPFILSVCFIIITKLYKKQHHNDALISSLGFMTWSSLWLLFIYIFFCQASENRFLLFSQLMIYFGFPIFYIMHSKLAKENKSYGQKIALLKKNKKCLAFAVAVLSLVAFLGIKIIKNSYPDIKVYPAEKAVLQQNTKNHSFEDIAILIPSYDNYNELWSPCTKALIRNWPSLNTKFSDIPIYLVSNKKRFYSDRVSNIRLGKSVAWSNDLLAALSVIKQKYILMILDDYIINKPVDEARLLEIFEVVKRDKAAYVELVVDYLEGWVQNTKNITKVPGIEGLIIKGLDAPYRNSTQITIWEKDLLIKLLKKGETAWEFETKGNKRSTLIKEPFYLVTSHPVFSYYNAVNKRAYIKEVVEYIDKNYGGFTPTKMPIKEKPGNW